VSVYWAVVGRTRWGPPGKCHFWGRGGQGGIQGPPSGLLTFSWLTMETVTCTIIFGNEHVNARGQRQVINVLVSQELDTQSWKGPTQQLAQPPTPPRTSWPSGPCWNSPRPSGFSYIWFKHATTQFSANSLKQTNKTKTNKNQTSPPPPNLSWLGLLTWF